MYSHNKHGMTKALFSAMMTPVRSPQSPTQIITLNVPLAPKPPPVQALREKLTLMTGYLLLLVMTPTTSLNNQLTQKSSIMNFRYLELNRYFE